jgi:large subunit ribosomal protein L34e
MVGKKSKTAQKVQREGRYGHFKSRSIRLISVKVPGGRTVIHYKYKKPKKAHCARCKAPLAGVPRERPYKIRKMSKTQKRPERPFGGMLCSRCMRAEIIKRIK